jgi:serine/threonine-protein kinase
MGVVYRARREELDREFALKVIAPGGEITPELVARFAREAQAAARLAAHPNVVGVEDAGEEAGRLYLAMPLISGQSLEEWIDAGRLTPERAAAFVEQAARGAQFAHEQGVVHRDIKPANIMVRDPAEPKSDAAVDPGAEPVAMLTDFGLAAEHSLDDASQRLTHSGVVLGTVAYMPPEQARGRTTDVRADVYALGATLYEALCATPPFAGGSTLQVIHRLLTEPPSAPRRRDPRIPAELDAIVMTCLEKRPEDRYPTAEALADDLARFRRGEPTHARPLGGAGRAMRAAGRRKRWLLAAGGVGALASVLAWAAVRSTRDAADAARRTAQEQAATAATQAEGTRAALWSRLIRESAAHLEQLEVHGFDAALTPDAALRHRAALQPVIEGARRDHAAAALPDAWEAYADALLVRPGARDRLHAVARATTDDPYPWVLLARLSLGDWMAELNLPRVVMTDTGISLEPGPPTERGALSGAPALTTFLEGVQALTAGRFAEAARTLAGVSDEPLLGRQADLLAGVAWYRAGDSGTAAALLERAAARGSLRATPFAVIARVSLALDVADDPAAQADAFQAAADAATAALERGRTVRHIYEARSFVYSVRSELQARRDESPAETLDLAIADLRRAVALPGAGRNASVRLANLLALRARWAAGSGATAREWFDESLAILEDVLREFPGEFQARLDRGRTALDRVLALQLPAPELVAEAARTVTELEALRTAHPDKPVVAARLLAALTMLAQGQQRSGDDPDPALQRAWRLLETIPEPTSDMLILSLVLARFQLERLPAGSPQWTAVMQAAVARADAAVSSGRRALTAREHRGILHGQWMTALLGRPAEARARFDAALADYDAVLEARPTAKDTWQAKGELMRTHSMLAAAQGSDPVPWLRKAVECYEAALALRPDYLEALINRGRARFSLSEYVRRRGEDSDALLEGSLADLDAAVQVAPTYHGARSARALTLFAKAQLREQRGEDAAAVYARVLADLQRALEPVTPDRARLHVLTGLTHWKLAERAQRRGEPAGEHAERAVAAMRAALALDPLHLQALQYLSQFLWRIGRADEAVRLLDEAAARAPANPQIAALRDALKRALGR